MTRVISRDVNSLRVCVVCNKVWTSAIVEVASVNARTMSLRSSLDVFGVM